MLQAGDLHGAHAQLQDIVAAHPDNAEALRLLGGLKQGLGDSDDAEALLRRAMTLDPNWAPTLMTLGEVLLASGRGAEAEPLLRRAATRMPQAALLLARHYNDQQRHAEALSVLEPFCATGQAPAELVTQHVNALAALGRHEHAVAFYRRFAEAAPEHPGASHALAIALAAASRHQDAERMASHALARGHRSASVHFTHARSLVALGDFAQAEAALRDGLQQDPRNVDAHNQLARLVWMRTGDTLQSTARLDHVLRQHTGDEALLAAKAAILQGAGEPDAALACLSAAAERPQASPALLVRAGLAALDVDPAVARHLAERALARSPTTNARHLLAAALLGTGEPERALAECEGLLVATPDDQYLIALQTTAWRLLGDPRYAIYNDHAQLVRPYRLPTPAAWPDLPGFLADLRESLRRLHDPHGHPLLFQSLRHGTETTADLARHADPVIQALFQAFDEPIRDYLDHVGHGDDALRRRNHGHYRFNGSWSVQLRSAGYHTSHVHPRGWISSAFYVDLPEGMATADTPDGCLAFGEPGIATQPSLHAEHMVRPQSGQLVLFPSYLWHGTVPFHSDHPRLTVAFDAIPEGPP